MSAPTLSLTTNNKSIKLVNATNVFFLLLLVILFLPNKTKQDQYTVSTHVLIFVAVLEVLFLLIAIFNKKEKSFITAKSIIGTIFFVLLIWTLLTAKFNVLEESLFPSPENVFRQLIRDKRLLGDVLSSLKTLSIGYFSALFLGIFLGSLAGMSKTLSTSLTYITTFLKLIPPIVYIPYAIALLPKYGMVSVFVIFMSAFWPIFSATFAGVANVDKQYLNSASVLNVGFFSRLWNVILPASLSEIFIGCNQAMAYAFILLTSAEMIGGSEGIGYYIKYYSNFGDFTRIIVGILVIGITISIITVLLSKLQSYLLRWKPK